MFKKIAIGVAVAGVLASGSAFAGSHGSDSKDYSGKTHSIMDKAYGSITAGSLDFGYDKDPGVVSGILGVDLDCYLSGLGAEAEITGTVSDGEVLTSDLSYTGAATYVTYGQDVGRFIGVENLDAYARAGVGYGEVEIDSVSVDGFDPVYGVGIEYDPQKITGIEGIALRVDYTERDYADGFSAGVSYAF